MERTLFGALNMSWTVMFLGYGLMMVGASNDSLPDNIGLSVIAGGILYACISWLMHWRRIRVFESGMNLQPSESLIWTAVLTFLLAGSASVEL